MLVQNMRAYYTNGAKMFGSFEVVAHSLFGSCRKLSLATDYFFAATIYTP